jgi:hypothetical protein
MTTSENMARNAALRQIPSKVDFPGMCVNGTSEMTTKVAAAVPVGAPDCVGNAAKDTEGIWNSEKAKRESENWKISDALPTKRMGNNKLSICRQTVTYSNCPINDRRGTALSSHYLSNGGLDVASCDRTSTTDPVGQSGLPIPSFCPIAAAILTPDDLTGFCECDVI